MADKNDVAPLARISLYIGCISRKLCERSPDTLQEMREGFAARGWMVDGIAKKAQVMFILISNLGMGKTLPITKGYFTPGRGYHYRLLQRALLGNNSGSS